MHNLSWSRLILAAGAALAPVLGWSAPFRAGDRVCFFGDSVTHHGYYTSQIQTYYYTRHPHADIRIFNCGVGGEKAADAALRFEGDIAARKPSHIAFVFGANDVCASAYAPNAKSAAVARRNLAPKEFEKNVNVCAGLFRRLTPNAKIMWCTPPAWDDALIVDGPTYPGVTQGESKLAKVIIDCAQNSGDECIDFFNPMVKYNAKLHSKNPHHSLVPDRIHPREAGGLFMANAFLKHQKASSTVSYTVIDAARVKAERTVNGTVAALKETAGGNLEFTLTEKALPFPIAPNARGLADDINFESSFNRQGLKISNLAAGDWELRIDGRRICVRSHEEWQQSVNLAAFTNTPMMVQAQSVAALVQEMRLKENRWRSLFVGKAGDVANVLKESAEAEKALDELHGRIRALTQPVAHRFELIKTGPWARPELVAAVEQGKCQEALVSWWGFDKEDSTRFLRAAINSKAAKLTLDQQDGAWISRQLALRSNLEMIIPKGVELLAERGQFRELSTALLTIASCTNVTIRGGGGVRMWFEDYVDRARYSWSEWRHAVSILGSKDITLENLRVSDSGGDGLYVGRRNLSGNNNITVRDVVFSHHNRQGISVITVNGLLIERCILENTCGTLPMAGIDFEPNSALEELQNIVVRDTVARGNHGSGFDFSVFQLKSISPAITITLENCRSEGNRCATKIHRSLSAITGLYGKIIFRNCLFNDCDTSLAAFKGEDNPLELVLENCRAAKPGQKGEFVTLDSEYGWKRAKTPTWPDGSALRTLDTNPGLLARAVIHDAKPGEMVKLPVAHFRGKTDFLIYAAKAGDIHLASACRKIGRLPFDKCSIEVADLNGKLISRLAAPTEFEKETPCTFTSPAPGFYRLTTSPGRGHALRFTATEAPIGAVKNLRCTLPSNNGGESEVYVRVPRNCRRFGIMGAGGGGEERLRLKITDPTGREVYDKGDIALEEVWLSPEAPLAGIWKLSALKPSKGCLDDYSVALVELPTVLFLSPEKTWELPLGD